ncbi:MAG: GNAT family N-acetyltransferase [Chlamydiota bacterium]
MDSDPIRMESSFTIELYSEDRDLGKIVDMINAAYKRVRYLKEDATRITEDQLRESLSNPQKQLYLCISSENVICGSIFLEFFDSDEAEIEILAVDPKHRGMGLGPMLLKHAEKEAFLKRHMESVRLNVIPLFQESLIAFYHHLGYQSVDYTEFPEEKKIKYIQPEYRELIFLMKMRKWACS